MGIEAAVPALSLSRTVNNTDGSDKAKLHVNL